MTENNYPDLNNMCRLCLREELASADKVDIFPSNSSSTKTDSSEPQLSIPVRIMSCAALEVQSGDGLPKAICTECRYQLEKCYYFRKRSQAADSKLRKHIRLLNMGKKSRMFVKSEDLPSDDEMEYEDSLQFIKEHDELLLVKEKEQQELWKKSMHKTLEEKLWDNMQQERQEMKLEIENQLKARLREEVRKECRQQELRELLNDLETFLKVKRSVEESESVKPIETDTDTATPTKEPTVKNLRSRVTSPLKRAAKQSASTSLLLRSKKLHATETKNELLLNSIKLVKSPSAKAQKTRTNFSIETTEAAAELADTDKEQETESNYYILEADADMEEIEEHTAVSVEQYDNEDFHYGSDMDTEDSHFQLTTSDSGHNKETTSYEIARVNKIQVVKKDNKKQPEKEAEEQDEEQDDLAQIEQQAENVVVFNIEQPVDAENMEMVEFVSLHKKFILMESPPSSNKKNTDEDSVSVKKVTKADRAAESKSTNSNDSSSYIVNAASASSPTPIIARNTDTPKTFRCSLCPMAFSMKKSLSRHMRVHVKMQMKGVSYQCSDCHIYVSSKSALTRHMLTHSGVRPHICPHCNKSFTQREVLKRHLKTHTSERPHKCQMCGRCFSQKVNLVQHINQNHLEVPKVLQHACHICPKRFNHASGLSRHLASHAGVAFQCSECSRHFADRSSIKRHIATVHGSEKELITVLGKADEGGNNIESAEELEDSEAIVENSSSAKKSAKNK